MRILFQLLFTMSLFFSGCNASENQQNKFVQVENGHFVLEGKDYAFIGANYWQGMNLGAPQSGDRARLMRELDQMQAAGINNLRILAASEADAEMKYCIHPALQSGPGEYNNDLWLGLDFLLSEMAKRDMKAVMVMGNFWTWSGGFPQYVKWAEGSDIPFPQDEPNTWDQFQKYSANFYLSEKAQEMLKSHIRTLITRTNTTSGISYKNDPTIMAWQLANEPRGFHQKKEFAKWTRKTSAFIKSLDANHLVSLGTEGNTSSHHAGVNVREDNDDPNVDYLTMHIWIQNWSWFKPGDSPETYSNALKKVDAYWSDHIQAAKELNKPLVFEEFGVARDSLSYQASSSTKARDQYFDYVMSKALKSIEQGENLRGLNFWSYSGEGRPPRPGEFWKIGDTFVGDPPHELQGWYGIYDQDTSTLSVIKHYSDQIVTCTK